MQFLKNDPTDETSSKKQLMKDESMNVTALNFILMNLGREETETAVGEIICGKKCK